MARPTRPKDLKPRAVESEHEPDISPKHGSPSSSGNTINLVMLCIAITLCTTIASAASMYFLAPIIIKPMLAQTQPAGEGEEGEFAEEGEEGEAGESLPGVGPVVDLEEFTVNLKDRGEERYLRADLSLMVTAGDPQFENLKGEALHQWQEEFHLEMAHYVPAIRDIVISSLTKRTAAELGSTVGKEQIKNEIKRSVDALFHGKHQVIRVNFENFIIQ
jgi:flagellar FliL protein